MDEHGAARPLTDNEKAARFIGWKPEQRTKNFCHVCAQRVTPSNPKPWSFDECHHQTLIPAPDMKMPENIIKALKYLQSRSDGYLGFGNGWRLTYNYDWHTDYSLEDPAPSPRDIWGETKDTLEEAVLSTLVALYDAEQRRAAAPPQPKAKE